MDRKEEIRQRTKRFAVNIIHLYCALPKTHPAVQVVGKQMLRAGTAVAAIYREASRARSKADFVAKIELCTQEADETQLWLEVLHEGCSMNLPLQTELWQEANELIAIFVTMAKNTKGITTTSP
ncbi:MAG: four helix bundle protein [Verrucomicrobia bacterium]|nr:MAG: four helix bundle protein [Verrucomicrobiota bacterium]